jgi:hypothetical protein
MPRSMNALTMGTSVSVAKYINAPAKEAMKLAKRLLPPTQVLTAAREQ